MKRKREYFFPDLRKYISNDTSIISSNCFAGLLMQDLGMEYNSPTLGLFFNGQDYVEFLSRLRFYLTEAKLTFPNQSKLAEGNIRHETWSHWYPIGLLDGKVEIHFLHYHTEQEAAEKWYRRAKRVNFNKLLIIGMEQNWIRECDIQNFDKLPFDRKIIFTKADYRLSSAVYMHEYKDCVKVGDPYADGHIYYRYLVEAFKKGL